jgi:hypothetical protein
LVEKGDAGFVCVQVWGLERGWKWKKAGRINSEKKKGTKIGNVWIE